MRVPIPAPRVQCLLRKRLRRHAPGTLAAGQQRNAPGPGGAAGRSGGLETGGFPQPRRTPAPLVDCLPRALPARVCHSPTSDLLRRGASCQGVNDALDTIWVVICATLVMMMQLGFAMLESGSVREHNVVATLAKNVLDVLIGTLTT